MKDINGQTVRIGNFIQFGRSLAKVIDASNEKVAFAVPLGEEWYNSRAIPQSAVIKRDRSDFCPLRFSFMTDEELAARIAQLDQECPDLTEAKQIQMKDDNRMFRGEQCDSCGMTYCTCNE